jgi:PBP1b-binding outer membrane lipoprotein LpoB
MKKIIAALALLLIAAILFGCMQKTEQKPPEQPPEQPQVTIPVENIAADELAKEIPSGDENMTGLDDILIGTVS